MKKVLFHILIICLVTVWSSCTSTNTKNNNTTTPSAVDVTNFTATAGSGQVVLSWTIPSGADIKEFDLTYSPGGTTPVIISNSLNTYTVSGLTGGTAYTFTLKTKNSAGNLSTGVVQTATPSSSATSSVTATIGGASWASSNVSSVTYGGEVIINATQASDASSLRFEMFSSTAGTTYNIDGMTTIVTYGKNSNAYSGSSGTVKVISNANGVMVANFAGTFVNTSNSSDVVTISNGAFTVNF